MRNLRIFTLLSFYIFLQWIFAVAEAQTPSSKNSNSTSLSAEAQGAKALLEDLISRRYTQELSTMVDHQAFAIGTSLELVAIPPKIQKPQENPPPEEPMTDLMLGVLDPEELLKKFSPPNEKDNSHGFLANYQIKTVEVNVGLREGLGDETKAAVEKWLTEKLNKEFNKAGKGKVSPIKMQEIKEVPKKKYPQTLLEFLDQFQSLSGQIVLGLAILLAVLLWKILGASKANANVNLTGNNQVNGQIQSTGQNPPGEKAHPKDDIDPEIEKVRQQKQMILDQQVESITNKISLLLPKVGDHLESIVRSWCQMGDSGRFRLACFAEVVGKDLGKLPIPIDALSDVTKIFNKMPETDPEEKKQALEKIYWDFLATLNLGPESLSQPFAYLGGMNLNLVNQILLEENPKMKTLVSLFMPEDLRNKYIANMTRESKLSLLTEATQLGQIGASELKTFDGAIANRIKPSGSQDIVVLEKTFQRVAGALSPSEEVSLLHEITHQIPFEYKQNNPSLAFLGEWPDDKISLLLGSTLADELTNFLRVRGDLKERMIRLSPPMTAEMVTEELQRPGDSGDKERDQWILSFTTRLRNLVKDGTISLEDIFKENFETNSLEASHEKVKQAS